MTDDEARPKVRDPEETPAEVARRLLARDVNSLADAHRKLRKRLKLHVRNVSDSERKAMVAWVRRDCESTIAAIEDTAEEATEFSFAADYMPDWNED